MKKNSDPISSKGGDRKYRVKKATLSKLEDLKLNQFEKHLIQEGIKQVVFAEGNEEFQGPDKDGYNSIYYRAVPKETIRFLLDYDMIEEYKY